MSKKLLFNGCSMTAGDEISWHKYHPDVDWWDHLYLRIPHPRYTRDEVENMRVDYIFNLRKKDNLSGQVSKLTGLAVEDLSEDGNSNQNICMTTISFLSELSPEERKNYHVCIGWSSLARKTCWHPAENGLINLNVYHVNSLNHLYFSNYIKEVLINATDMDLVLDYFHNVIALQSYLKANNMTYTFWNTLISVDPATLDILNKFTSVKIIPFKHELLFDKKDWISFKKDDCPWIENHWALYILDAVYKISDKNAHPNLKTVIEFAKTVSTQINKNIDT